MSKGKGYLRHLSASLREDSEALGGYRDAYPRGSERPKFTKNQGPQYRALNGRALLNYKYTQEMDPPIYGNRHLKALGFSFET